MKKILRNFKSYGIKSFDVLKESIDVEKRTILITASSETPYMRFDDDMGQYLEVLGHNEEEVDLSRLQNKAGFLYEHDKERQIGVVEEVYLNKETKQIFALIRFSKNSFPNEVFNDVVDGIRSKISIGYKVLEAVIDGYDEKNIPIIRVVKWQPIEISSVSTPADDTVGVIRSISLEEQKRSITIEVEVSINEDKEEKEIVEDLEKQNTANITEVLENSEGYEIKKDLEEKLK